MIEIVFAIIIILLLLNYCFFVNKINAGLKKILGHAQPGNVVKEFASIIIPFRNESDVILDNLASIERLDYPSDKYEVIYVDDSSSDDGYEKLKASIKNDNIKIVQCSSNGARRGHKKKALQAGIDKSRGQIIITTDADCVFDKDWLSEMIKYFDDETAFVSGPVNFAGGKGLFFKVQLIEFASLVMTGAGLIGGGTPSICNGANLAYRKNVFDMVKGFAGNLNLSSGDDELLMQKIASQTNYKIKFCASEKAVVRTKANRTLRGFINQRKRWASKSVYYKNKTLVAMLVLIYLFYLSVFLLPFAAVFVSIKYLAWFFIGFIAKCIVENSVMVKSKPLLGIKYNVAEFIATEIFQITYIVIMSVAGLFGNYKWKDRKIVR